MDGNDNGERPKWRVGDVVHVLADMNRRGGGTHEVSKVGRKWFTVRSGRRERRFDIVTGREDSDGVGGFCYALTPEQYADHVERSTLLNALSCRPWLKVYNMNGWPVDRLRRLLALAEEEQ